MANVKFEPSVHTGQAFLGQLDRLVSAHPDGIIIGSVGRSALLGVELDPRGEKGVARDFDITNTSAERITLGEAERRPFGVDVALQGLITITQERDCAAVIADTRCPGLRVEMPAEVFEPFPVFYAGVRINTFHPDTMANLHRIQGTQRPKDLANARAFMDKVASLAYTRLPESYFEPLRELEEMISADIRIRRLRQLDYLRAIHNRYIPSPIRRLTTPPLRSLRKLVFNEDGKERSLVVEPAEQELPLNP